MGIVVLSTLVLAAYLVVGRWAIPRIEKHWPDYSEKKRYLRAGSIGFLTTIRTYLQILLMVFGTTIVVVVVGWILSQVGGLALLGWLHSVAFKIKEFAEGLGEWLEWSLSAVVVGGLGWFVGKGVRDGIVGELRAEYQRQVAELIEKFQSNELPEISPNEKMNEIAQAIHQIRRHLELLAKKPSTDRIAIEQATKIDQTLMTRYLQEDIERRVDLTSVPLPQLKGGSWWPKIQLTLLSKGMFETLETGGKWTSRVVTGLATFALIGVSAPALAATAFAPLLDTLNQVYVAIEADKSEKMFEFLGRAQLAEQTAEEPVYRQAAQQFVRAISRPQLWRSAVDASVTNAHYAHSNSAVTGHAALTADDLNSMVLRDAIVHEYANSHGHDVAAYGLGQTGNAAVDTRYAAVLADAGTDPSVARTELVDRVERALAAKAHQTPGFDAKLKEQLAKFKEPVQFWDLTSSALGDTLGEALDKALPSFSDPLKVQARRGGKSAFEKTVDRIVKVRLAKLLDGIERGQTFGQMIAEVGKAQRNAPIMYSSEALHMEVALDRIASDEAQLASGINRRVPTLAAQASESEVSRAKIFAAAIKTEKVRDILETSLGGYDALFVGNENALLQSPLARARPDAEWINQGVEPKMAMSGDYPLAATSSEGGGDFDQFSLSRNAKEMARSPHVGGVVFGEMPLGQNRLNFSALQWKRNGRDFVLSLRDRSGGLVSLGTFSGELIQQALAYAADQRTVAVTILTTGLVDIPGVRRIALHPALINTQLGRDIIELDKYTYQALGNCPDITEELVTSCGWSARVSGQIELYSAGSDMPHDRSADQASAKIPNPKLLMGIFPRTWNRGDMRQSIFAYHPQYYSIAAVKVLQECAPVHDYWKCVRGSWPLEIPKAPKAQQASGVREGPYALTGNWNEAHPLHFVLQIAYSFPRAGNSSELRDDSPVQDDGKPAWEFPLLKDIPNRETLSLIRSAPQKRVIYEQAERFVRLQRLFRLALAGRLGATFDRGALVVLMREARLAGPVNRVPTPDWDQPRSKALEALAILKKRDKALRADGRSDDQVQAALYVDSLSTQFLQALLADPTVRFAAGR